MSESIGGYFELELENRNKLHADGFFLNSARNCLKHILIQKQYSKIHLPYYTCEVLLEPIKELEIEYKFYHIDKDLNPIIDFKIGNNETIIFINYFGVKTRKIQRLTESFENCIVDNSQALFSNPIKGAHCFYSPRKFIGIPDGGILFSPTERISYDIDHSINRASHLLMRLDSSAEKGYNLFVENDLKLVNLQIRRMSKLTRAIYNNANLEENNSIRNTNFNYLHSKLGELNNLSFNAEIDGPMVYPLFIENGFEIRKRLLESKVYTATYWNNILSYIPDNSLEISLVNNLVALPVDQRITKDMLDKIIKIVFG